MWYGKNDRDDDFPPVIVITSRGKTQRYERFGLWNIADDEFVTDAEYAKKRRILRYTVKPPDIGNLRSELEKHFEELLNK